VILPTPDVYATIRTTVHHIRCQTISSELELVLVGPPGLRASIDTSETRGFTDCKVFEISPFNSIARAYAVGTLGASAPIVAFAEDHCFPDANWAEALVARHRGPWAAVGPCLSNANPVNAISWADMLIAYAPWMEPAKEGETGHLPGHNSSYKREFLLNYGDRLADMLEAETVLHWDLRNRGFKLFLEPKAKSAHTNFAVLPVWIKVQFHCGRVFGADRARHWNFFKRSAYAAASPLIPAVRLLRMAKDMRTKDSVPLLLRSLHMVLFGLSIDAVGQCVGYARGPGRSPHEIAQFEFHRERYSNVTELTSVK
jgi:hypothetical protein